MLEGSGLGLRVRIGHPIEHKSLVVLSVHSPGIVYVEREYAETSQSHPWFNASELGVTRNRSPIDRIGQTARGNDPQIN